MSGDIDAIWASALHPFDAAWELRLGPQRLAVRDPERRFTGASMVKTLLAALIDADVSAGALSLTRPVQVTRGALTAEDGLLRFGQIPTMHRLSDLLLLMIAVSDNTATTTLIELLGGPAAITARFAARDWSSVLHEPGFSEVCLADHQDALASIGQPLIRSAFHAQQDRRALARRLVGGVPFAHKTGTVERIRHDAGVLATPRGPLWVACFTDGGPVTEHVDHPACVAMGAAMVDTLLALGLGELCVTV